MHAYTNKLIHYFIVCQSECECEGESFSFHFINVIHYPHLSFVSFTSPRIWSIFSSIIIECTHVSLTCIITDRVANCVQNVVYKNAVQNVNKTRIHFQHAALTLSQLDFLLLSINYYI